MHILQNIHYAAFSRITCSVKKEQTVPILKLFSCSNLFRLTVTSFRLGNVTLARYFRKHQKPLHIIIHHLFTELSGYSQ